MKKFLCLVFAFFLLAGNVWGLPSEEGVPYSGATQAVDLGSQNLSTTGTISGGAAVIGTTSLAPDEIFLTSTGNITAAQMGGGFANNYGQAAENTQTLPASAANLWKTFVIGTAGAGAFHVKAAAGDKIYFNGTALDDEDKVSCATPAVGDYLSCRSFKTGASAFDWICTSGAGTWTDGGA